MKGFDCLKMKEEIQAKVYEKTKDMTFPELRAYLDESLENDAFWHRLVKHNAQKRTVNPMPPAHDSKNRRAIQI